MKSVEQNLPRALALSRIGIDTNFMECWPPPDPWYSILLITLTSYSRSISTAAQELCQRRENDGITSKPKPQKEQLSAQRAEKNRLLVKVPNDRLQSLTQIAI